MSTLPCWPIFLLTSGITNLSLYKHWFLTVGLESRVWVYQSIVNTYLGGTQHNSSQNNDTGWWVLRFCLLSYWVSSSPCTPLSGDTSYRSEKKNESFLCWNSVGFYSKTTYLTWRPVRRRKSVLSLIWTGIPWVRRPCPYRGSHPGDNVKKLSFFVIDAPA